MTRPANLVGNAGKSRALNGLAVRVYRSRYVIEGTNDMRQQVDWFALNICEDALRARSDIRRLLEKFLQSSTFSGTNVLLLSYP